MPSSHAVSDVEADSDKSVNCVPIVAIISLYDGNVCSFINGTHSVCSCVLGSKSISSIVAFSSAGSDGT